MTAATVEEEVRSFIALAAAFLVLGCTDDLDALRSGDDSGLPRDGEPADASPSDAADMDEPDTRPDEPPSRCCVDLWCEGCNGAPFGMGGCGPEYCGGQPIEYFQCPVIQDSDCPDCTMVPEAECSRGRDGNPGCEPLYCDAGYRSCHPYDDVPAC